MYLFDMDGTLIDSNDVWKDVDREFLARRGLPYTKAYYEGVAHTIFPLAAKFTKEFCNLPDSEEDIMAEWMELAKDAYAHVTVRPGVRAFLKQCKAENRRMALVTSSVPEHCRTALDKLDLAREILAAAKAKGVKFLLPADVRVAMKFEDGAETFCTAPFAEGGKVPEGGMAIDIGDKAIEEFSAIIKDAKTVLWNGPMGVFEMDCFAKGTKEVAEALADSTAISIVGGGDSVTAAKKFKVQDKLSFCSTGGGASLELLEGKVLPGVGALTDKCCCGK